MAENLADKIRESLGTDKRLLLMERAWKDGGVTYLHAASTLRGGAGHIEDRVGFLNSLLASLEKLYDDLGYKPGKMPFRSDDKHLHFGQILLDGVVLCIHPAIEIAEELLAPYHGQMMPLRVEVSRLGG